MLTFLILSTAALGVSFVLLLVTGLLAGVVNAFFGPSKQEQAEAAQLLEELEAERVNRH